METTVYTLKVSCNGENLVTRTSDNLSRLTACLFSLLEYDFSNAMGEIVDNHTGKVIRRCRKVSE